MVKDFNQTPEELMGSKKKINRMERRWKDGVEHDPRAIEIYEALEKLDYEEGHDSLMLKSGGDGDIGESLMYLLDVYFEDKDNGK